jgi:hypothetical protein
MHKLVVLLMVLCIDKFAVLVRSLASTQLHLDIELLKLRLLDLSWRVRWVVESPLYVGEQLLDKRCVEQMNRPGNGRETEKVFISFWRKLF